MFCHAALHCAVVVLYDIVLYYIIFQPRSPVLKYAIFLDFNYSPPLKSYIQRSVDEQFLNSIIEGHMNKLENLLQLGANIAYSNPNSQETAVSLCINYHSVDLLKFLENRGSVLTSPADAKGLFISRTFFSLLGPEM